MENPERCDVVVIGGGIAGISIGYELAAAGRRVTLLEAEPTLAFHTTGRSAATWVGTYGNAPVRALTAASHDYFVAAPPDLHDPADGPIGREMAVLHVASVGLGDRLQALYDEVGASPDVRLLAPDEAVEIAPMLRRDWLEGALIEPAALEVDVARLHQGYKRGLRAQGGTIHTGARVVSATRSTGGTWRVSTEGGGVFEAPYVVNAAGAWADQVATVVGAEPLGIEPRLRSVFMIAVPDALLGALQSPTSTLPMVLSIDEENPFYLKGDAGQYLCSPADATPTTPHDARPDELEIARAIEVINEATTLGIRSIRTPWAGLRSFAPDLSPVIGEDPEVPGFFWYAGQGGYGIQMGPAAARLGAALLLGHDLPADIAATGFDPAAVRPDRFRAVPHAG